MFALTFSSKTNDDIVSTIGYIKNTLQAPMAAENHVNELKKVYEKLKENPYSRPLVHDKYDDKRINRRIKVSKNIRYGQTAYNRTVNAPVRRTGRLHSAARAPFWLGHYIPMPKLRHSLQPECYIQYHLTCIEKKEENV